jgi:putative nucleotidyltransferase with HDIG domain
LLVYDDEARRKRERLGRRTTRMDGLFAFDPGGAPDDVEPLYTREDAEFRASEALGTLPPLPAIVVEASREMGPEEDGLEDAVEKAPDLASSVLAVGGTSLYRGEGPRPQSMGPLLEKAGAATFRSIAFTAFFKGLFSEPLPWYGYEGDGHWRHLLATAAAARKVGERLGFHKLACEVLFLAGLFHDVGKPTVQALLPEGSPSPEEASNGGTLTVLEAEVRTISMNHAELVHLILDMWGVERSIFPVAQHHHAPQRAGKSSVQASIVRLADVLANQAGVGLLAGYGFASVPVGKAAESLGLDGATCDAIQGELGWAVAEVATEFENED